MTQKSTVAVYLWVVLYVGIQQPSVAQTTCAEFTCSNGNCVKDSLKCNNWNDCGDGSDEYGCGICSSNLFRCQNGNCVKSTDVCNYGNDCGDNSDEFGCEHCSAIQFRCPYGNCINSSLTCNGVNNCPYHDNTDERGCYHKGTGSTFPTKVGAVNDMATDSSATVNNLDHKGTESTFLMNLDAVNDMAIDSSATEKESGLLIAVIITGIVGLLVVFTVSLLLMVAVYKHRHNCPKYHRLEPAYDEMHTKTQSTP